MTPPKKSRNCLVPAIIGGVVFVCLAGLIAFVIARNLGAMRQSRAEALNERALAEAHGTEVQSRGWDPVVLREGALPDYTVYQAGGLLSPDLYLAWKLDTSATTLARSVFLERIRGASVRWDLRAEDLTLEGDGVRGIFQLSYSVQNDSPGDSRNGAYAVLCNFAASERDSLLKVRRGDEVSIEGRLQPDGDVLLLESARLVTSEADGR